MPPTSPASAFVPARGLAHPYAQTAFGVFGRRPQPLALARERLDTPDQDFLELDVVEPEPDPAPSPAHPERSRGARGFVVLVHGLEGSARSGYMRHTLALARARGLAGIAMNFRACGDEENRLARSYHSGETGDLGLVVRRAVERWPGLPGIVIGFSLGANITLKWLAEQGAGAPDAIRGAVAVSCPYDLAACANRLDEPQNWWMRLNFLRALKRKAIAKAARFPHLLDAAAIRRTTTFREFDDIVTAPLNGFRDFADYWTRASCAPALAGIARPTLAISAEDDPLIPASCIPVEAARRNRHLTLEATSHGGHVGFVAGSVLRPRFWAEERAIEFAENLFARA